jgi:hypothetical protein
MAPGSWLDPSVSTNFMSPKTNEGERRRPRGLHRLLSNMGWKRNRDFYESDLGDVDSSVVFEESYADSGVARE